MSSCYRAPNSFSASSVDGEPEQDDDNPSCKKQSVLEAPLPLFVLCKGPKALQRSGPQHLQRWAGLLPAN